jgi:phospholipase C
MAAPIEHIVVLMLENCSFDSMLGSRRPTVCSRANGEQSRVGWKSLLQLLSRKNEPSDFCVGGKIHIGADAGPPTVRL